MIKILKNGKIPGKTYETICSYCECEFTFDYNDAKEADFFKALYIECPCCKYTCVEPISKPR